MLTKAEKKLFNLLIHQATEKMSSACCDDCPELDVLSEEERFNFVKQAYKKNGDPENFDPKHLHLPNWWVLRILADKILYDGI